MRKVGRFVCILTRELNQSDVWAPMAGTWSKVFWTLIEGARQRLMAVTSGKMIVGGDGDLRETLVAKEEQGLHLHQDVDQSKLRYAWVILPAVETIVSLAVDSIVQPADKLGLVLAQVMAVLESLRQQTRHL